VLGFVPVGDIARKRRRRGADATEETASEEVSESPALASPLTTGGRRPRLVTAILLALVCGAVSLVVLPPPWAVPIALATALAAMAAVAWSPARAVLSLSAVVCVAAAGAVTVFDQARHHYPPGDDWPHNFETAGVLALIGVVALATDTAVELVRRHRRRAGETEVPNGDLPRPN
jgi:hypothetical protein